MPPGKNTIHPKGKRQRTDYCGTLFFFKPRGSAEGARSVNPAASPARIPQGGPMKGAAAGRGVWGEKELESR